jgi:hypothetical protein
MTADYPHWALRLVLAVLAAAAVAALGGIVLGEYPFTGAMPYVSGVFFALVVSEVAVGIGRRRGVLVALTAAVCSGGGLGWAVWISSGRGVVPIPLGGWLAIVLGVTVALGRCLFRPTASSAPRSRGPTG